MSIIFLLGLSVWGFFAIRGVIRVNRYVSALEYKVGPETVRQLQAYHLKRK